MSSKRTWQRLLKYLILFVIGGALYCGCEMLYRSHTHWTMFLDGGICFVALGMINQVLPWKTPLWQQALIGSGLITAVEYVTGYIVNVRLHWHVWDYSRLPCNLQGQICLLYTVLWIPLSVAGIMLDDWIRWRFFDEQWPKYSL